MLEDIDDKPAAKIPAINSPGKPGILPPTSVT